ncbi:MAG: Undecaprenyl-phosphate galactose phosphotransferase, partial [Frankiales bacterium]|nr:Undecaprenyl-phosphate galactose phosphotransferase [Frankiales bacterium]
VGPLAVAGLGSALVVDAAPALAFSAAALVLLLAVRTLAWLVVAARRRRGKDMARALVVGRDDRAATLARTLSRHPDFGLQAALVVDGPADPETLARLARDRGCEHVFLLPDDGAGLTRLRRSLGVPAHVSLVPFGADAFLDGRTGHRVGGVAVLPLGRPLRGPAPMPGKRAVDVVVSSLLLLVLGPVLLACLAAVRVGDGGPSLYRQRRTGLGGRPFDILKLRTMRSGADTEQLQLTAYNTSDGLLFKMQDDPRVTRVGRLLRRSGLDELPQLVNVLRGEMSLVGPRPLPVDSDAFGERDAERHLVRPGMTGLWQVSGGATLRYREMVDLDLAYVHGWTPGLDLQVLTATVGVLLRASLGADGRER